MFGLDGVEIGLLITLVCLFAGILSGYPVAFAIGGAALVAFGVIGVLSEAGWLVKEVVDHRSEAYHALLDAGVKDHAITLFRYPTLPTYTVPVLENGIDGAFFRILTFIVNRINERVLAGPSIELLLAVAMFILMGISLERSRIAQDLLTSMARVFGGLPGGLAVSVVVVGAFLAASTGIVGATVVTMGLLSLPTMLRSRYSPELATGVISASGTLGQIIPPSIVIVLLGSLAGDLYATAQEERAIAAGCRDALTFLGQAAVVSVGTLFKAAIVPGLLLTLSYAVYVFCYALLRPEMAPAVTVPGRRQGADAPLHRRLFWLLAVPGLLVALAGGLVATDLAGPQRVDRLALVERPESPELRTHVSEDCQTAMIELHGQEKWDRSVEVAANSDPAAFVVPTDAELDLLEIEAVRFLPPVSRSLLVGLLLFALALAVARGVAPTAPARPLLVGAGGIAADAGGGCLARLPADEHRHRLAHPRPAHPRGAVRAPPRAAPTRRGGDPARGVPAPDPHRHRSRLHPRRDHQPHGCGRSRRGRGADALRLPSSLRARRPEGGRFLLMAAFAVVIFLLVGTSFDLRTGLESVGFENWLAFLVTVIAYHIAFGGLVYACVALVRGGILRSVVRDTAKVTAMVFAILIGSQMLNLVVISFGGEEHIQQFLRSFDDELVVFLVVMLVLFILGFVLDFLEIIYIVIPIVGPVIYGGTLDPKWVTIMIAVNLQTSFLTPPFGFALFYLRGVAPPSITTGQIYRGVLPFVCLQIGILALMWFLPEITTFLPELLPEN